jgi:hypothetical protein
VFLTITEPKESSERFKPVPPLSAGRILVNPDALPLISESTVAISYLFVPSNISF